MPSRLFDSGVGGGCGAEDMSRVLCGKRRAHFLKSRRGRPVHRALIRHCPTKKSYTRAAIEARKAFEALLSRPRSAGVQNRFCRGSPGDVANGGGMKYICLALGLIAVSVAVRSATDLTEPVDETWTKQRLIREMAGLGYESAWVDRHTYPMSYTQGLYLARVDDPRSWSEIVGQRPKRAGAELWHGLVVVDRSGAFAVPSPEDEWLQVGPFCFFGDP